MENKRVLVAVILSMAVLLGWNFLFPPSPPRVQPPQEQSRPAPETTERAQVPDTREERPVFPEEQVPAEPGELITVETPQYVATFNSAGGILESFSLKQYMETIAPGSAPVDLIQEQASDKAPMGVLWERVATWRQGNWSVEGKDIALESGEEGKLVFQGTLGNIRFVRTLHFKAGTFLMDEDLLIVNQGQESIRKEVAFTLAAPSLEEDNRYNQTKVAYLVPDGLEEISDRDDLERGIQTEVPVAWAGIENNYFLLAVSPLTAGMNLKARMEDGVYRVAVEELVSLAPGGQEQISTTYYLGPKDDRFLDQAPNQMNAAIDYGWFDFIAKPLLEVLNFFYKYVGNYGIAIILLTVVIKILFWPLSQKSYKSMEQMKKLQPVMTKIREKYKDDRQKMNQEMMQLYKTYKVNPAGGCLPMLLQIPVFIALYQALLGAIEMRHASFIAQVPFTDIVWLADLSAKDPFYITPIIMGATMFLQQKMTPTPGDPTQAKIMMFMPIIFTFLFLSFPAGLVLYWLVNNVLSIGQQWLMTRKA
ncbi:MAG: membrane protein insertase YidC [Desulfovibrionales bacterium]